MKTKYSRRSFPKAVGALFIMTTIISCGGKKTGSELAAPQGMISLDLTHYGKPFALFVPDTAKAHLMITEESTGALYIRIGENFGIAINEQSGDLELLKKDLHDDEINKLKKIITEEPSALFWESEIVKPEFHFFLNKKLNNNDYSFEDIKDTEKDPFSQEDIRRMFEASRNAHEIKKETNS
jgi:hypothetical protein